MLVVRIERVESWMSIRPTEANAEDRFDLLRRSSDGPLHAGDGLGAHCRITRSVGKEETVVPYDDRV